MHMLQPHLLTLVKTHTDGAEEWICPTCGHRVLIDWNSTARKTVITPGDTTISHVGGCATRQFSPHMLAATGRSSTSPQPAIFVHEELGPIPMTETLHPWLRWMQSVGLANAVDTME